MTHFRKQRVIAIAGWAYDQQCFNDVIFALEQLSGERDLAALDWGDLCWSEILQTDRASETWQEVLDPGQPPCVLVGWSLGGMLALDCAAKAPEAVREIILVGATACFREAPEEAGIPAHPGASARDIKSMQLNVQRNEQPVLDDFTNRVFTGERSELAADRYTPQAGTFSAKQLLAGLDYLAEADLRETLSTIKARVTILHGTEDVVVPFAGAEYLNEHLTESRLVPVDGAGHGLVGTHPHLVAAEVADAILR